MMNDSGSVVIGVLLVRVRCRSETLEVSLPSTATFSDLRVHVSNHFSIVPTGFHFHDSDRQYFEDSESITDWLDILADGFIYLDTDKKAGNATQAVAQTPSGLAEKDISDGIGVGEGHDPVEFDVNDLQREIDELKQIVAQEESAHTQNATASSAAATPGQTKSAHKSTVHNTIERVESHHKFAEREEKGRSHMRRRSSASNNRGPRAGSLLFTSQLSPLLSSSKSTPPPVLLELWRIFTYFASNQAKGRFNQQSPRHPSSPTAGPLTLASTSSSTFYFLHANQFLSLLRCCHLFGLTFHRQDGSAIIQEELKRNERLKFGNGNAFSFEEFLVCLARIAHRYQQAQKLSLSASTSSSSDFSKTQEWSSVHEQVHDCLRFLCEYVLKYSERWMEARGKEERISDARSDPQVKKFMDRLSPFLSLCFLVHARRSGRKSSLSSAGSAGAEADAEALDAMWMEMDDWRAVTDEWNVEKVALTSTDVLRAFIMAKRFPRASIASALPSIHSTSSSHSASASSASSASLPSLGKFSSSERVRLSYPEFLSAVLRLSLSFLAMLPAFSPSQALHAFFLSLHRRFSSAANTNTSTSTAANSAASRRVQQLLREAVTELWSDEAADETDSEVLDELNKTIDSGPRSPKDVSDRQEIRSPSTSSLFSSYRWEESVFDHVRDPSSAVLSAFLTAALHQQPHAAVDDVQTSLASSSVSSPTAAVGRQRSSSGADRSAKKSAAGSAGKESSRATHLIRQQSERVLKQHERDRDRDSGKHIHSASKSSRLPNAYFGLALSKNFGVSVAVDNAAADDDLYYPTGILKPRAITNSQPSTPRVPSENAHNTLANASAILPKKATPQPPPSAASPELVPLGPDSDLHNEQELKTAHEKDRDRIEEDQRKAEEELQRRVEKEADELNQLTKKREAEAALKRKEEEEAEQRKIQQVSEEQKRMNEISKEQKRKAKEAEDNQDRAVEEILARAKAEVLAELAQEHNTESLTSSANDSAVERSEELKRTTALKMRTKGSFGEDTAATAPSFHASAKDVKPLPFKKFAASPKRNNPAKANEQSADNDREERIHFTHADEDGEAIVAPHIASSPSSRRGSINFSMPEMHTQEEQIITHQQHRNPKVHEDERSYTPVEHAPQESEAVSAVALIMKEAEAKAEAAAKHKAAIAAAAAAAADEQRHKENERKESELRAQERKAAAEAAAAAAIDADAKAKAVAAALAANRSLEEKRKREEDSAAAAEAERLRLQAEYQASVLSFVEHGASVDKYCRGWFRRGQPQNRFLHILPSKSIIEYSKKDKGKFYRSISYADIVNIQIGGQSKSFKDLPKEKTALAFSIVTKKRTFDLVAKDGKEYNMWMTALKDKLNNDTHSK